MKSIKQFNPLDAEFLQRCFSSTMTNFTSLPKCSLLPSDATAGAKTKAQFRNAHQMTLALLKERLLKCLKSGGSLPAFFLAGHSVLDKRNMQSSTVHGQTSSSPLNKTSIRGRCFSAAASAASLAVPTSLPPRPRLSLRDTHGSVGDRPSLGSGFHLCRSST